MYFKKNVSKHAGGHYSADRFILPMQKLKWNTICTETKMTAIKLSKYKI